MFLSLFCRPETSFVSVEKFKIFILASPPDVPIVAEVDRWDQTGDPGTSREQGLETRVHAI